MSVQKDGEGKRWVQAEVEVVGTPEQVWAAIATGEGVSSWFVPTEKRDDGTVVSHFGPGMDAVAKETVWDPPHRFAADGEMGPGGPKLATEWTVEAKAGGTCIVRVVHSLFASTDDWDDQLGGIEKGWGDYFALLQLYVRHFAREPCHPFQVMGMCTKPAELAWKELCSLLGLQLGNIGEPASITHESLACGGVLERLGTPGHTQQAILRLSQPAKGLAHLFTMGMGGMTFVSVRFYLYGEEAADESARLNLAWNAFMAKHFPMPGSELPCA